MERNRAIFFLLTAIALFLQVFAVSIFAKHLYPLAIVVFSVLIIFIFSLALKVVIIKFGFFTKFLIGSVVGLVSMSISINLIVLFEYGISDGLEMLLTPIDFLPLVSVGWLTGGFITVGVCAKKRRGL